MKSFGIFLISLALIVAYGESRIASDAPGNNPSLMDLITQAQNDIAKLGKELHDNLNLPDEATVINTLKNHSTSLVNNVKNYVQDVSKQVASKTPEFEKMLTSFKLTLNKAADDVGAQIPIASNQIADLESKFFKGIETIVQHTSLFTQTLNQNSAKLQEDVSRIAKKAVEMAVEATQQLTTQVQQYAKPKA